MTAIDQIAASLAYEVGFTCHGQGNGQYAYRRYNAGVESPPLRGPSAGPNPCYEVPLGYYEIYMVFEGSRVKIHNVIVYDLNDPKSIDQIKHEFADLNRLRERIKKAERDNFMLKHYGKTFNEVVNFISNRTPNGEPGFVTMG